MPAFHGPQLAADALELLADANWDDVDPERATVMRQQAQVYATLAVAAAVLTAGDQQLGDEATHAWTAALNPNRKPGR